MSASNTPAVELVPSREIELFLPVLREVDLGDPFLLSMLHWCGIGKRQKPIGYWQVYLIRVAHDIVGVTGLYQRPQADPTQYWLGWFGVRPHWRRQGIGSATLKLVMSEVQQRGGTHLWVYTGVADHHAVAFYGSLGFELLGPASQCAPAQTMDDSDVVLRAKLPD